MDNNHLTKLISQIAENQDKAAFSDIFQYFAPRIMGYLINSGSKKEFAEEITQEVLSTVWVKANKFDQIKGNVSTWVFTISRNKRIDKLRKNEVISYNADDLIDALYPQENLEGHNFNDKMTEINSNLNENERKLIKMNFLDGKTHKTISRELEIPLGTVKSRIRTILNKMKSV